MGLSRVSTAGSATNASTNICSAILHVRLIIEDWRADYNAARTQTSLNGMMAGGFRSTRQQAYNTQTLTSNWGVSAQGHVVCKTVRKKPSLIVQLKIGANSAEILPWCADKHGLIVAADWIALFANGRNITFIEQVVDVELKSDVLKDPVAAKTITCT